MSRNLCMLGCFVSFMLPQVAFAQSEEDPGDALDSAASLTSDIQIISESNGWEYADTEYYVRAQLDFNELVFRISDEYPDHFSSAVNLEDPYTSPVIYFKGTAPAGAIETIQSSRLGVEVVQNTGMNAVEWERKTDEIVSWLKELEYHSFLVAFDSVETINVVLGHDRSAPVVPDSLRGNVTFSSVPGAVVFDEGVHGGGEAEDGGTFECTFGWCVEDSNGVRGVLSAAHCNGLDTYVNPDTSTSYTTSFQLEHSGTYGDLEWHTTNGSEWPNWFADEDLNKRRMDGLKTSWSVNDSTCVFGMASFERMCDQIYATSATIVDGTKTWRRMVIVDNNETVGGDSGAGWSLSTIAHGVHKGEVSAGGAIRDVYTRATRVDEALDVTICESP